MSDNSNWLIYGANGYTGRRIAEEACRRSQRPVLAGRSGDAIQPIAQRLGCEHRVFSLDDPRAVKSGLQGVAAVLHCAGPFTYTARPMIDGCLAAGAHYLDITGEIDVIEMAAARSKEAVAAGISLLPAVGFDVVPSDCLAALVAAKVPQPTSLLLGINALDVVSPGTAKTGLEMIGRPPLVRRNGVIQPASDEPLDRDIPLEGGTRRGRLTAWGDVASAYYSTGVGNIAVYMVMADQTQSMLRRAGWVRPLLRLSPVKALARRWIEKNIPGPSDEQFAKAKASLWCEVRGAGGDTASATLQTPGGYRLTVLSALECVSRVLRGEAQSGFHTPSQAFGANLILDLPETELRWQQQPSS